jgi:hypothetical protein
MRKAKFGEARPLVHVDWKGQKFVAAGPDLHYSKDWKMFPDFLFDYLPRIMGDDWGKAQLAKPLEQRHEILKWWQAACEFDRKQRIDKSGLFRVIPNGQMKAFLALSYDLFTVQDNAMLQQSFVNRLKHKYQFQGARHELFAAATCIRAGCDIAWETDSTREHVEFVATHKASGQKVSVEAKSRHRPGVLGFRGHMQAQESVQADVYGLLKDALTKPKSCPYVIFLDLNLPPTPNPSRGNSWFDEIRQTLRQVAREYDHQPPVNLVVVSNQPHHYGVGDEPAPMGNILSVIARRPRIALSHPEVIRAIHDAARKYGKIPNTFEEAS